MKTLKIEFEGTDGAGKTTGLKYFIERAKSLGLSVVETREVGNPNIQSCVKMREFVLDPNSNLDGRSMEFIFSAMRIENDRWLKSLQSNGKAPNLVVSDRGWFSHLSYTDHNVSPEFTQALYMNLMAQETLLPDVVIYFSVNTDTALKRRIKRGEGMDVIEMKGVEYQEKVRDSFDKYLVDATGDVYVIDANDTIEGVQAQLNNVLESIVKKTSRDFCGAV
jgi:dTMP kinase